MDKNFPLFNEFQNILNFSPIDENGRLIEFNLLRQYTKEREHNIVKQIHSGYVDYCNCDWKKATVLLALSDILYGAGEELKIIHKIRIYALKRMRGTKNKNNSLEEKIELMKYLKIINISISHIENIFRLYGNPDHYFTLWKCIYNELKKQLDDPSEKPDNNAIILAKMEIDKFNQFLNNN